MHPRRLARPLLAASLLLAPRAFASPLAGPPAKVVREAEELVRKGLELRKAGKDDDALAAFRKAYELTPAPRTLAQIALAEQALGLFVAAERDLVAALESPDPWIASHKGTLEEARATVASRLGSLDVRTTAAATVLLDDEVVGVAPLEKPLRVVVGTHTVLVRKEGFEAARRSVTVASEGLTRETIPLVAAATPDKAPEGAAAGAGGAGKPVTVVVTPASPARTAGWALLGGGAAIAALGGGAFLLGELSAVDHNRCARSAGATVAGCQSSADATNSWRSVGRVGTIGGGGLVIVGAALVLASPGVRVSPAAVSCTPTAGPTGAGLACAGRF